MKNILIDTYVYIYNFKSPSSIYSDVFSNIYFSIFILICIVSMWGLTLACLISKIFAILHKPIEATKVMDIGIPVSFFLAIAVTLWMLFALVFNKKILKLKDLPKYNGSKAKLKAAGIIVGTFLLGILSSI